MCEVEPGEVEPMQVIQRQTDSRLAKEMEEFDVVGIRCRWGSLDTNIHKHTGVNSADWTGIVVSVI